MADGESDEEGVTHSNGSKVGVGFDERRVEDLEVDERKLQFPKPQFVSLTPTHESRERCTDGGTERANGITTKGPDVVDEAV